VSAALPAVRRCAARRSDDPSCGRRATPAGRRRCGGGGGTPFHAPRSPRYGSVAVRAPVRARGSGAGRRASCRCVAERASAVKARVLHARAWNIKVALKRRDSGLASSAEHLVVGSTTSSFFTRIARTILARPLVTTSLERFSCQKLVKTCMHSHAGIWHRLGGSIRIVPENASCGVEHHGVNAQMPTYAYAQQVRTSSPSFPTNWLREFCTLH